VIKCGKKTRTFFSEEKNQKTFTFFAASTIGAPTLKVWAGIFALAPAIKIFCFFSSEMGIPFTDLKRRSLGANGKTVCLPLPQKIIRLQGVAADNSLF
jgi:hypothetical protein